mgnify:FL=1
MVKIGDTIYIEYMEGEPQYSGRVGIVRSIDDMGQIHGSWGGLAINPEVDQYIVNPEPPYEED